LTSDPLRAAFPAMGTTCEVTIVGGTTSLVDLARARVEELEARWSRFRADSEISRLNRRAGQPTALTADSYLLVDHAVAGWRWTHGRYDPTVLSAIEAAGYDRSFELVAAGAPGTGGPAGGGPPRPAPGCAGIALDPHLRAVTLPPGVGFDPGGIGKGLAADLVVDLLLAEGAAGACVSVGGDGRMAGEPPPGGWRVGIGNPYHEDELLAVVELTDHGIATSSRLMRRWSVDGVDRHHLLDPRSGRSIDNGLDTVTVIAGDAWVAEILAKAAFVDGGADGARLLTSLGVAGLLVETLDRVRTAGGFAAFVVQADSAA
jgi:thiamine biosynthesis lipoprotein